MSDRTPLEGRPYRRGVGVVLINGDGQVFVAQRIDTEEPAWQMPQGGIDEGEGPFDAAMRELEEEIGTADAEPLGETDWLRYDLPPGLADKVWKGRFRGQEQKWFLMRFRGEDSAINLETDHPEFSDWQWVDLKDLPDLIVPFKRPLYEQIIAALKNEVAPVKS